MYLLIFIFVCTFSTLISQNLVIQDSVKLEIDQVYASNFNIDKLYHIVYNEFKSEVDIFSGSFKKIYKLKIKEAHIPEDKIKSLVSLLKSTTAEVFFTETRIGFTNCIHHNIVFYFDYNMQFVSFESNHKIFYAIDGVYTFEKKSKLRKGYLEYTCVLKNKKMPMQKATNINIEKRHKGNNLIESLLWYQKSDSIFILPMYKDSVIIFNCSTNTLAAKPIKSLNYTGSKRVGENGLAEKFFHPSNVHFKIDTINQVIYRVFTKPISDSCDIYKVPTDWGHVKKKYLQICSFSLEPLVEVEIPYHYYYAGFEKGLLGFCTISSDKPNLSCGPDYRKKSLTSYWLPLSQWNLRN